MYFIPTEAYQHWPIAVLGTNVFTSEVTVFGVENTG